MSWEDMDLSHDRESFTSLRSKHRSPFIGLLTRIVHSRAIYLSTVTHPNQT